MLSDQGLIQRIVDPVFQLLRGLSRGPHAAGRCFGILVVVCFATSTGIINSTPAAAQDVPPRVIRNQWRSITDDLLESKQRIETPTPWLFPKDEITLKPLPPIPMLFPVGPTNADVGSGAGKPTGEPSKLPPQAVGEQSKSNQASADSEGRSPAKQAKETFPAIVELNELQELLAFDNEPATPLQSARQSDSQPPAEQFEVITSASGKPLQLPKNELGNWTKSSSKAGVSSSASAATDSQVGARASFNDGLSFSFIDASQAATELVGAPVLMWSDATAPVEIGTLEAGSLETGSLETGSLETGSLETGSLETGSLETADPSPAFETETESSSEVGTSESTTPELTQPAPESEVSRIDDSLSAPDLSRTKPNGVRPARLQAIGLHDSPIEATDRDVQASGSDSKAITWEYMLSKLPRRGGELVNSIPVWVFFAPIALLIIWVLWPAGEEEDDGVEEAKRNLEARAEREREKTLRTEEALARAKAARDAAKTEVEQRVDQDVEATEGVEAAPQPQPVSTPAASVSSDAVEEPVTVEPVAGDLASENQDIDTTDSQPAAESGVPAAPELDPLAPFFAVGKQQSSKTQAGELDKPVIPKKLDDLTKLQGIDVVIQQALYNVGYYEYKDLQMADPSDLQYIISSFDRDIPCDGNEWSRQAAFAGRGDWTGLNEYLRIKGVVRDVPEAKADGNAVIS